MPQTISPDVNTIGVISKRKKMEVSESFMAPVYVVKPMPHSHQSLNMFKSYLAKHGLKLFASWLLLTDL